MTECVQVKLHAVALPLDASVVQGLPSSQLVGHLSAGFALELSQVSLPFLKPSPQPGAQSISPGFVQLLGQQPSPLLQTVTAG